VVALQRREAKIASSRLRSEIEPIPCSLCTSADGVARSPLGVCWLARLVTTNQWRTAHQPRRSRLSKPSKGGGIGDEFDRQNRGRSSWVNVTPVGPAVYICGYSFKGRRQSSTEGPICSFQIEFPDRSGCLRNRRVWTPPPTVWQAGRPAQSATAGCVPLSHSNSVLRGNWSHREGRLRLRPF